MPTLLPLFYPDKQFKKVWNFAIYLGTFWCVLVIPVLFVVPTTKLVGWALWIDNFVVALFLMDLLVNMRTAVYVAGEPVSQQTFMLKEYLRGWFVADLLSALPFAYLAESSGYPQYAAALGLLRLVRVLKVPYLFQESSGFMPMGAWARIAVAVCWLTLTINIFSCAWAAVYPNDGIQDDLTFINKAVYWAIMTLSSTGYGDILATNNEGRALASWAMLCGVLFNGFITATMSSILIQANAYRIRQQERLVNLASFFKQFGVPKELQNAIFSYYANSATETTVNNKEIIENLPEAFQKEVMRSINMHMIGQVPLFKDTSAECLAAFATVLISEIFNPGQDIIEHSTIGKEMFFLQHGIVEVLTAEGYPITRLRNNSFFGEMALLGGSSMRTATIRAVTVCDIYRLEKTDFDRIMEQFPAVKNRLTSQSGQRKAPPVTHS